MDKTVDWDRVASDKVWHDLDTMRAALSGIIRRAKFDPDDTDEDRRRHMRHIRAIAERALSGE